MRRDKRVLGLALLLSVLFSISLAFGLGVVDVSYLRFGSSGETLSQPPALIFTDPAAVVDDTKQAGAYVWVHVNISDVTDLFAWQINMSWDSSMLSVNSMVAGEFLLRTSSANKTASFELGHIINVTDNAAGYTCLSESILGDVAGESGDGRLISVEFLVLDYGATDLNISLSGTLPTTLLDSAMATVTYDTADGYFRNYYPGDVDGDKYVGSADAGVLNGAYGSWRGDVLYVREADFDDDGYIGSADAGILNGAYGTTYP